MITRNLDKRGIKYELIRVPTMKDGKPIVGDDGNVVTHEAVHIISVPADEQAAIDFFADDKECWFGGCEELRRKYNAEVDKAMSSGGCTSCQKNKIMRKYIELVKEELKRNEKLENIDGGSRHTGTEQVSGPSGKGDEGAGEKQGMLRRAASRIKKILRAFTE